MFVLTSGEVLSSVVVLGVVQHGVWRVRRGERRTIGTTLYISTVYSEAG